MAVAEEKVAGETESARLTLPEAWLGEESDGVCRRQQVTFTVKEG